MKGKVALHHEQKLIDLGGGVTRRILSYDENLMSVEVSFETGAVGAEHTHPHTQCSYVLSGKFSYSVEGEAVELKPGDSIVVPSGLIASYKAGRQADSLDARFVLPFFRS